MVMDTKIKVLFLEDEDTIREVLKEYMMVSGYQVTEAADGEQAIQMLEKQAFDLAVLDIMVPEIDGFGVLEYIREKGLGMGVIMLTALEDDASQVKAFNHFADDYVIKPVSPIILLKRMETIMRRIRLVGQPACVSSVSEEAGGNGRVQIPASGGCNCAAEIRPEPSARLLTVNKDAYTVSFKGKPLPLTLSEFLLFQTLYESPERVFTREMLILRIYNEDYIGNDRIIDAHVKNLRKKLPVSCIRTVIGVGYRYDKEGEERYEAGK